MKGSSIIAIAVFSNIDQTSPCLPNALSGNVSITRLKDIPVCSCRLTINIQINTFRSMVLMESDWRLKPVYMPFYHFDPNPPSLSTKYSLYMIDYWFTLINILLLHLSLVPVLLDYLNHTDGIGSWAAFRLQKEVFVAHRKRRHLFMYFGCQNSGASKIYSYCTAYVICLCSRWFIKGVIMSSQAVEVLADSTF